MITALHPEIIQTNILAKLDGATLACAAATSPLLHAEDKLWRDVCIATWPSINDPRLQNAISNFPSGYRSFFSYSSTTAAFFQSPSISSPYPYRSSELISAVDIRYNNNVIYSKVQESDDFLSVDILHSKKLAVLPVNFEPNRVEETLMELEKSITLSWILIDPAQNRSLNLASHKPILSQRNHYNPGQVQLLYVTILPSRIGLASNPVQCRIVITCGGKEGGEMHVTGVNMQVQDIEGNNLSCEESMVILQSAIESERKRQGKEKEAFEEFLEMKRARKERRIKTGKDYMKDLVSLVFQLCIISVLLCGLILCKLLAFWRRR